MHNVSTQGIGREYLMNKYYKSRKDLLDQNAAYLQVIHKMTDEREKLNLQLATEKHAVTIQYGMAAALDKNLNRCNEMVESLVNELHNAEYEGKNKELLKTAKDYLQIAVGNGRARAFMHYEKHEENIIKANYNVSELNRLTRETLESMRKKDDV